MQKTYTTPLIKRGIFLGVGVFIFVIILGVKVVGLAKSGQHSETETAYALRYVIKMKPFYKIDAYIDHINLETLEVSASHSVDSDVNDISIVKNNRILLSFYGDGSRFFRKVCEYYPRFGWTKKIIETEGVALGNVISVDGHYFVVVNEGKKAPEDIKKNPKLSPYQRGVFEVFGDQRQSKKIGIVRLAERDSIQDIAVDDDSHRIYVASLPFDVYDSRFPELKMIYNYLGYSYINVIDTQKQAVINRIDVSDFLKNISGIECIEGKLYVTALDDKDYDGDLAGEHYKELEFKKKNPGKEYKWRKRFHNKAQESLFVFSLNPFKLEKKIFIKTLAFHMEYDEQTKHLFIEHKPPMGSKGDGLISVVDINKGEAIHAFKIPGYKMMSLGAPGKLLISSSDGLHIVDTKSLKIIKTIPGYYTAISERF